MTASPVRPAPFRHSANFASLVEESGGTLLVSTYQAGQLATFGSVDGVLRIALEPFRLAMGIAVHSRQVAVGADGLVWRLERLRPEPGAGVVRGGGHDEALLARSAHVTGPIHAHEMAFVHDELWVVNTLFSCLCTLDPHFHFIPRWKPPFITDCRVPGDRCHLNGLAVGGDRLRYVTALSETDTPNGWRPEKHRSGVLLDVETGEAVARGFAMPHSPRLWNDLVLLLDSGRGTLVAVDVSKGTWETVATLPGYARGLAVVGRLAFVGLSRIRETSVFSQIPIAERRESLKCGLAIVDLQRGELVSLFEFVEGIEEIFDVRLLPGPRSPLLRGPVPPDQNHMPDMLWTLPRPIAIGPGGAS